MRQLTGTRIELGRLPDVSVMSFMRETPFALFPISSCLSSFVQYTGMPEDGLFIFIQRLRKISLR